MTKQIGKVQEATVTVQYVGESRTRGTWSHPDGRRRFVIGATKTSGECLYDTRVGLTTLDQWKASLCLRAQETGKPLHIKFRDTKYFDADLLFVEFAKEPAHAD